ncbi:hypothetical protein AVEN_55163-1 [Araneus ventricosus]|uniref:Uncharacterized protein n=1 Tax=Araneus ventricosus TaxID=182803 RepID=A0A4Y2HLD5_ARAVE|nr:hypothetical protein AVEN_55163-1 [Araneus ventricosus]
MFTARSWEPQMVLQDPERHRIYLFPWREVTRTADEICGLYDRGSGASHFAIRMKGLIEHVHMSIGMQVNGGQYPLMMSPDIVRPRTSYYLTGLFWYPRLGWETSLFPPVNDKCDSRTRFSNRLGSRSVQKRTPISRQLCTCRKLVSLARSVVSISEVIKFSFKMEVAKTVIVL